MDNPQVGEPSTQSRIDYWFDYLNVKLAGASKVESRIMGLEVLPRVMAALESKSPICSECAQYHGRLFMLIDQLPAVVQGNDTQSRSEFELAGKDVVVHLSRAHGLVLKGKRKSIIALWTMLLGMLVGAMCGFTGVLTSWGGGLILGWLAGMAIGAIAGAVVETRLRKKHLLY